MCRTPTSLEQDSWTPTFDRAMVPAEPGHRWRSRRHGRAVAWMRVTDDLGDPDDASAQLLHRCWLAYLSDDMPTDSVIRAHPDRRRPRGPTRACSAPASTTRSGSTGRLRADRWHLYDFSCHHYVGGRGLSLGHVFEADGTHVATVAQEVLVRDARDRD